MIKLTKDNIKDVKYSVGCVSMEELPKLLESLLDEVRDINDMLTNFPGQDMKTISIYWENDHTEYSHERTDPCPDDYGFFYIMMNGINQTIGEAMTIDQLDESLLLLYDFVEMQIFEKDEEIKLYETKLA